MKKGLLICFVLLIVSCNKKSQKSDNKKSQDSIVYSKTKEGIKTKTIFYPSKQKDSFKLRTYYVNDKLKDSCYITDGGFILGKRFSFNEDNTLTIGQYLNVDNSNYLNQYWTTKKRDTFFKSNFYQIKTPSLVKKNKYFQLQIILKKSYRENFSKLFFLTPREHYSVLKSDFSNYKEIEFDTIHSLLNDGIPKNEVYEEDYWNKRAIAYKTGFSDSGKNYIRGILVERKDTLYADKKGNEFKFIDRYLFVNKEVYVNE